MTCCNFRTLKQSWLTSCTKVAKLKKKQTKLAQLRETQTVAGRKETLPPPVALSISPTLLQMFACNIYVFEDLSVTNDSGLLFFFMLICSPFIYHIVCSVINLTRGWWFRLSRNCLVWIFTCNIHLKLVVKNCEDEKKMYNQIIRKQLK